MDTDKSTSLTESELQVLRSLRNQRYLHGNLNDHDILRKFWCCVMLQQLFDAASLSSRPEVRAAKQEAIVWLTNNNRDFRDICDFIGLNPDNILQGCRRIFFSADPERYLKLILPNTRTNGYHNQSRRGPKSKTIHDYS